MSMFWIKHRLCEFQALIEHFLMRELIVSDDFDLSD